MLSALRDFTPTTQKFWGCDNTDTGGVLGVLIDGVTPFTGDTLVIGATDFCGLVAATGLSGTHTYQMTLDGTAVGDTYTFTVAPKPGAEFSMLFMGDTNSEADSAFNAIIAREEVACVFASELYYLDSTGIFGGGIPAEDARWDAIGDDSGVKLAEYLAIVHSQYRVALTTDEESAGRIALQTKWPIYEMSANHPLYKKDAVGNNPGTNQYDAAYGAYKNYSFNGMPASTGVVDSEPAGGVLYYNVVIGDIELIVLDGTTYSDSIGTGWLGKDGNGNNSTVGSNAQVAWFKDKILTSTANVIVVFPTSMVHSGNSEWFHETVNLNEWLSANKVTTPLIFVAPDTHQSFAHFRTDDGDYLEVGCSPTGAATSAKTYPYISQPFNSDMFDKKAKCTNSVIGTELTVDDTSIFRNGRKVVQGLGTQTLVTTNITLIDSPTVMTMATSRTWVDGETITAIDWPVAADITNDTIGKRLCSYAKVLRWPNGTIHDPNPHTEVKVLETYTGNVKFRGRVRDGERTVRLYTSRSSFGVDT